MKRLLICFFIFALPLTAFAAKSVVNVYTWAFEIPDTVVRQFEKETGIKVNISTYDNNEVMYAKLRASKNAGYDLVLPSSYYVDRMRKLGMLEKLDKTKLSNWKNLNPIYLHGNYDPGNQYSVPHVLGATGIFVNKNYYSPTEVTHWAQLWEPRFDNQLLLLDDVREVFSMALITLGYSSNDQNPEHIKAAFLKLKELMKNVKVFSTATVASIMIDADARIGTAWNGDAYRAYKENPNIRFTLPSEGFAMWVDSLTIPKNAPHRDNAYLFINFILRADIAKEVALSSSYMTANFAGQQLLPAAIRDNPMVYPPKEVLAHAQFQTDVSDETLALYEKYWEELKMSG